MTATSTAIPTPRESLDAAVTDAVDTIIGAGRVEASSDGSSRWYAHPDTGEQYLSVTYVTGAAQNKPWLVPWSAKLAAEYAVDHVAEWHTAMAAAGDDQAAAREAAIKLIKTAAAGNRAIKADVGTYVHDVIEALFLGADIPLIPDHLAGKTVEFDGDLVTLGQEWLDSMVDGFLNFVADFGYTAYAAECTVASNKHKSAGTIDGIGRLTVLDGEHGALTLLDTKTGRHLGPDVIAQLGTYASDDFTEIWLRNGLRARRPAIGRVAVLHVRPSYVRGYKLLVVDPGTLAAGFAWWETCRTQLDAAAQVPDRFGTALYPPLSDGSQPPPMVEDLSSFAGCSRAVKPLTGAGVVWMSELAVLDRDDVLALPGVGKKTVDALAGVLAGYGLSFRGESVAKEVA